MDLVESYLLDLNEALAAVPRNALWRAISVLHKARLNGRQVFIMGNGGSAATASHFACDLGKGADVGGCPGFRAIPLTDNMAMFSAYANDCGYEHVFSRQLANLVQPGDVVIGISGSGNSRNVLNAIELAHERGATTIGFIGFDGGHLKGMVDLPVHVDKQCMEQVEDVHGVLAHLVATTLRKIAEDPALAPESVRTEWAMRPAVFLDRDGVINQNRDDYVKSWEEFVFLPGVFAPLRRLADSAFAVVVLSNQSAIGRGRISREGLERIHERMIRNIEAAGGRVDGVEYCPHHPDDRCDCRKPRPGLLRQAASRLGLDLSRSYLVGDARTDVEAAINAGCMPLLVLTGRGKGERERIPPDILARCYVAEDLSGAVDWILSGSSAT